MNANTHSELTDVTSNILETIVFAFTEHLDELPDFEPAAFLSAEVKFTGSHEGCLTMIAPKALCQEWAEMMSEQQSETIHLDTLAELTNIIAGHWVSKHFSNGELPKLQPPKVVTASREQWDRIPSIASLVTLSVDDHALIVFATTTN